jgi:hypothetical protein
MSKIFLWLLMALGLVIEAISLYWFVGNLFTPNSVNGIGYFITTWFVVIALLQLYFFIKHIKYWKYLLGLFVFTALIYLYLALTHINFTL